MAIQIRRGTDSGWESNNSNIVAGEPAVTTDTGRFFVGVDDGEFVEFASKSYVNHRSLTDGVKQALLQLAEKVAYIDADGQDYYDALESALYPPEDLVSITAVYTQSGTVYDTDSLDSLKTDLVVTGTYSDSSTEVITAYTLSGTLTDGTSTITVSYGGKTTTFTVTVTGTIKLTNGTHNFTDGSYVTVTDNNHIKVYLATQSNSQARFVNPSDLDGNTNSIFSNSNTNNKSSSFVSLNNGETLTLDVFNASSDNTSFPAQAVDFAIVVNIRKQNTTTNVLSSGVTLYPSIGTTPGHDRVTEGTSSTTMTQNTVASNIVLYIPAGYPAQTTFECDVRIVKS